jgi:hypothetical protein
MLKIIEGLLWFFAPFDADDNFLKLNLKKFQQSKFFSTDRLNLYFGLLASDCTCEMVFRFPYSVDKESKKLKFILLFTEIYTQFCVSWRLLHVRKDSFAYSETIFCTESNPKFAVFSIKS